MIRTSRKDVAQFLQGFADVRQGQDGMRQHFAAGAENFLNHRGRNLAMGDIDGGFDHRENKALGAEAIELQVFYFGLQQAGAQVGAFRVFRREAQRSGLR